MSHVLIKTVGKTFDGYTIESFLTHFHLARKTRYLLMLNHITVNQVKVKPDDVIRENDVLNIDFSEHIKAKPHVVENPEIHIIYEDDDLVVVDKPTGLLVYDDGKNTDNLTGRLAYYYQQKNYHFPVLPVHRIDEDTSGMIIFAKNPLSLSYMSHLFEAKAIEKVYECLVSGQLKEKKGTIRHPIAKDRHESKMRVNPYGDIAITHYHVIDERNQISRLNVSIDTGRKHQIRVHLSHMGYSIIGDTLYHGQVSQRLMLHFKEVSFKHPISLQNIIISSVVPF